MAKSPQLLLVPFLVCLISQIHVLRQEIFVHGVGAQKVFVISIPQMPVSTHQENMSLPGSLPDESQDEDDHAKVIANHYGLHIEIPTNPLTYTQFTPKEHQCEVTTPPPQSPS